MISLNLISFMFIFFYTLSACCFSWGIGALTRESWHELGLAHYEELNWVQMKKCVSFDQFYLITYVILIFATQSPSIFFCFSGCYCVAISFDASIYLALYNSLIFLFWYKSQIICRSEIKCFVRSIREIDHENIDTIHKKKTHIE